MEDGQIVLGKRYKFIDWYHHQEGKLAPVIEVIIVGYKPTRPEYAGAYIGLDRDGIEHYGSAFSFRPLDWVDDRGIMMAEKNERGQGLVEYALILVLVAVVVIVILSLLGPAIGNIFSNLVNAL